MNEAKEVIVVIPAYGKWDMVQTLLSGLEKYETDNIDEVIIVDDCSPEPPNVATDFKIRLIQTEQNSGFTPASNLGLEYACAEDHEQLVFLISSDVRIYGPFIDRSAGVLLGSRRVLLGNRHINFDSGWNRFDGKIYDYLEGYFLAASGESWRDLDYFDPNYAPFDYEDIDLSTTAKSKGYLLVSLNSPLVQHKGGGTIGYSPAREAITNRNKEYFRKKWADGKQPGF